MASGNSLAQLEFYTNSSFEYFGLYSPINEDDLWDYITDNNILYIRSEHFPETWSLSIWEIIQNNPFSQHYSNKRISHDNFIKK